MSKGFWNRLIIVLVILIVAVVFLIGYIFIKEGVTFSKGNNTLEALDEDIFYTVKETDLYGGDNLDVLYKVKENEALVLKGEQGEEWSEVVYRGMECWVRTDDLTKEKKAINSIIDI